MRGNAAEQRSAWNLVLVGVPVGMGWNLLERKGAAACWSSLQNFSIYTTVLVLFSADNKVHCT